MPVLNPTRITATGTVKATRGSMTGFYVSSTSSGTLTLYDNTSASAPQITGTITPAVGWHAFPAILRTGLHAVIGGSLDVTFFTD